MEPAMPIPLFFSKTNFVKGYGEGGLPHWQKKIRQVVFEGLPLKEYVHMACCAFLGYFMFLICCYEACHYHRPSDDGRLRNSCKAVPSPTQTITTYPTSPSSSPSQYDESHFFRENVKSPPPSPPYRCCITGHRGVIMIVINIAIMIIIMIILRHKWHPGYNSVPNNAAGAVFPAFIITIITMYGNI